ncbi:MAG: ATP-grasp domain-containing protein [Clostridia bacterium]|nr:ATP-grasp domain-containing protein [Clostridia bacterium]
MKLLLTAVGKRVQLIKYLKKHFEVVGTDCSNLAPGALFVDKFYPVSKYDREEYKEELLHICQKENIDIVVSVFEQELLILDAIRDKLKEIGSFLILSPKGVLSICSDKWETYRFFLKNHIRTPESFLTMEECMDKPFPLFIKPRRGMGSQSAHKVNRRDELKFYCQNIKDPIIQEYVAGIEYTIDCICDFEGCPVSVVPRERLEVRAGEVSKSRTVKDDEIINFSIEICRKLRAVGPITIQCIKTPEGVIQFTEINPRMGGGVPHSFEAGVDYGQIFKDLKVGKPIHPVIGQFKEVTMLRYDEAVFI